MKIEEVKKHINKYVGFKGNVDTYKLTACILRKNEKGFYYQAELLDAKCGHALVICNLEEVETLKC